MENKNILLIDDEDFLRSGVKIALKKKGFNVTDASDGYEGMRHIIRCSTGGESYGLIILDIMMPKVSGVDILEYMIHKRITTPVLVITGVLNFDIKCLCSRLPMVDVLQKPFQPEELYLKIKSMFNSDGTGVK